MTRGDEYRRHLSSQAWAETGREIKLDIMVKR